MLDDQRCKAERRFVEQQQPRPRHQRTADRQHLLLAARQRAAALVDALLQPREQIEHLLESSSKYLQIIEARAHLQVFLHGHARENAAAFRRLGDPQARDIMRRQLRDVVAGKMIGRCRARGLPKIVIISVDLPAPLAPISVTISPWFDRDVTPLSARMLP